jgi:hypothetical protein
VFRQDRWTVPPRKPLPWQTWQEANPPDPEGAPIAEAPCAAGSDQPGAWPMVPWQSVLLKHPGAVPAAAGVVGVSDELRPPAWQRAQTGALPGSVLLWVLAAPTQGAAGCGAFTLPPWHPAMFRQLIRELPPEKSSWWQSWHTANPLVEDGAAFAAAPWALADAQRA